MSAYRTSSFPASVRTEVSIEDLRQLDVLRRILALLDEPTAGASELARLVDAMPVLVARLRGRFTARTSSRPSTRPTTVLSELTMLGNRDFEAVLFELLEDLTCLRAEQEDVPEHGSIFPRLMSVHPPGPTVAVESEPPVDLVGGSSHHDGAPTERSR